ncbi:NUDIX hydrolase domain-like protein [Gautieria morchelliformis]|nr:NUDIX hydrolase domain-like protein [Gautieria morchelliformis]
MSITEVLSDAEINVLTPKSIACLERLLQHQPPNHFRGGTSNYPRSMLAAVLVLLYEKAGSLRVLLTTRSKSLRSHPFQTALPGGKFDYGDNDMTATAMREANEEVGLPLGCAHIHVLGHLRPFLSLYKLLVTPVVALLTNLSVLERLTPSTDEVDHIFDHPLEAILDPDLAVSEPLSVQGSENWPYSTSLYSTSDISISPHVGTYRMHRFRSSYTPIKGLTADILITAAEVAYNRKTSYERMSPTQTDPILEISPLLGQNEDSSEAPLSKTTSKTVEYLEA